MEDAPHAVNQHIAEEIRALMGRRRVSQKQLGDLLGVTQGTMSKRLNGSKSWTVDELDTIAAYFGVGISDLLPPVEREDRRGGAGPESRNRWSSTALVDLRDDESPFLTTAEFPQVQMRVS